jgi:DNA recombination protein RmuC
MSLANAGFLPFVTIILAALLLMAMVLIARLKRDILKKGESLAALDRELVMLEERLQAARARLEDERRAFEEQKEEIRKSCQTISLEKDRRITALSEEVDRMEEQLQALLLERQKLESSLASLESSSREKLQAAEEKIALLEQAEKRLSIQFENLANRIFEEKHQKFHTLSKERLESLLEPVGRRFREFQARVEDIHEADTRERASLLTEITRLRELNQRMGQDAINLANALKGNSKARGNWGEIQLERILEESGLKKGREYETQANLRDEAGKRFRPDVIIHLPGGRDVVVDSKVSLVDYERFHSAENDREEARHAKAHVASMRSHIKELGAKKYDELVGINTLDMVIMFVPVEPALHLGLEHDPGMFNEAFNKGILLAGPSTLMAAIHTIHNIWQHEYRNRNVIRIAEEAGKLHDHFVLFMDALDDMGKHLDRAADSYRTARKRLAHGRGNLVGRVNKLRTLGARTRKQLKMESPSPEDQGNN